MLRLSFCGVSHSHFPHFGKPTQLFTKLRTSISVHTSYLDWHYLITTFGYTAVLNFFLCCLLLQTIIWKISYRFPLQQLYMATCYISIIKLTHQYVEKSMKTLPFCCYILKDYCQIVRDVSDQSISHLIFFKNSVVSKILYKA